MQQLKSINIPQPCYQSWRQMTPNDNGRHCQSCATTVTDFTVMTNDEIIAYLGTNHNVCGRLDQEQLDSVNRRLLIENLPANNKLKGWAMVVGMLSSITFFNACAQVPPSVVQTVDGVKKALCGERTMGKIAVLKEIKGRVTDNKNQSVPYAMIVVPLSNYKTTADSNGNFVLQVPYSVKQFTVNEVGYISQTIDIIESDDNKPYNVKLSETSKLLGIVIVTRPPLVKRMYYKFIKTPVRKLFK